MVKPTKGNGNGVEKIKLKIIGDARREAKERLAEAEDKASKIIEEAKEEVRRIRENAKHALEQEIKANKESELAKARINARKKYLVKKEELINTIIEGVFSSIREKPEYKDFIKRALEQGRLFGEFKVVVNPEDVPLVKSLGNFDIEGSNDILGVIIDDKHGKRADFTLQSMLEEKKEEVRKKVSGMITPVNKGDKE